MLQMCLFGGVVYFKPPAALNSSSKATTQGVLQPLSPAQPLSLASGQDIPKIRDPAAEKSRGWGKGARLCAVSSSSDKYPCLGICKFLHLHIRDIYIPYLYPCLQIFRLFCLKTLINSIRLWQPFIQVGSESMPGN